MNTFNSLSTAVLKGCWFSETEVVVLIDVVALRADRNHSQ